MQTVIDWEPLEQHLNKLNVNFQELDNNKLEKTWKNDWTETVFWDWVNQLKIENDWTPIFEWTATTWEDDNVDPTTLTWSWNLPTSINFASTWISVAWFSWTQLDNVWFSREYPHKAKLNNTWETTVKLSFHCHCYRTTATIGDYRLWFEYFFTKEWVPVTTSTTIYTTVTTLWIAWAKQSSDFPDITAPDYLWAQLHGRFFRDWASVLDTYNDVIAVSTIWYHYEIDSIWSHEKLVK